MKTYVNSLNIYNFEVVLTNLSFFFNKQVEKKGKLDYWETWIIYSTTIDDLSILGLIQKKNTFYL